jgi:auxin response factor
MTAGQPMPSTVHDRVEQGKKAETPLGCRLFGIDLTRNFHATAIPEKETISANSDCNGPQKQTIVEQSSKEIQSKHVFTPSLRSRTKVHMQGIAVGRAVDLTVLKGYSNLINEIENMFEINGQLHTREKWTVVFTDDEGDMMLVGDDPWPEFCKMVRKIYVYSSEEVKKISTKCKLSTSSMDGEGTGTMISSEVEHRSET